VALPHSGVVVSETALLEKLWSKINQDPSAINSEANGANADSVLHSWRETKRSEEHHFGSRLATAAEVQLLDGADREACWG
jgi:hypothetical protein